MKKLILMVCRGNIHRSVIAEACLNQRLAAEGLSDRYEVESRGLQGAAGTKSAEYSNIRGYPNTWPRAEPSLNALGIDIPVDKISTPITREDAEKAAVIFALDHVVLRDEPGSALQTQFPDLVGKMRLLRSIEGADNDVPDCGEHGSEDDFTATTVLIHQAIDTYFNEIIRLAEE